MSDTNIISRSLHDVGLAAWFGGTLFGATGLNESASKQAGTGDAAKVASAGWDAWTPVNLAAIGAHLVGSVGVLLANKGRVGGQSGVGTATIAKTAVLAASLAATAYSRVLGQRVSSNQDQPAEGGVDPAPSTSDDVSKAQRQLKALQWVIPALTGSMVVLNALHGEMQRPKQVLGGVLNRFTGN